MAPPERLEQLVAEGQFEPVEGWDFSWLEGRATEGRPPWGYARLLVPRVGAAGAVLDVQTGGGEVFAEVLGRADHLPGTLVATESWASNAAIARHHLAPFGVAVVEVADESDLPLPDDHFDLIISRHPTVTVWTEITRTLRPGGTYLSQQVGAGSNRELTDFMMGPQPVSDHHSARRAVDQAQDAGLRVVDLRQASLPTVFYDVGAVVYYLRKVIWTVPGFTVDGYRDRLAAMHEHIERHGPFVAHSRRFLIEATKPA